MAANKCEAGLVEQIDGLVKVYSDGSVVREGEAALSFPSAAISEKDNVLFKDVVFHEELGLWARLYLPYELTKTNKRVPVLLHFHASGFCMSGPGSPANHSVCTLWAARLGLIIISVKYRLAPEHRLPAAYHDSIAALQWLQWQGKGNDGADPWLQSHADFSSIFLLGRSAGGNIAHHLAIWAAKAGIGMDVHLEMEIKGMILFYPHFGGEDRLPSEEHDLIGLSDTMWRMALPVGSNRDHPFCNPVRKGEGERVDVAELSGLALPPILLVIPGRDIFRDRQMEYSEYLMKCGQNVKVVSFDQEDHGFTYCTVESQTLGELFRCISDFIFKVFAKTNKKYFSEVVGHVPAARLITE